MVIHIILIKGNMRYDIVGSFLAPDEFLAVKTQFEANAIPQAALTAAEDATVRQIVDRQLEAGLKEVTSGEVRRKYWDKDFYFHLLGVTRERVESGRVYQDEEAFSDVTRFTDRIAYNPLHPVFDDFKQLMAYTDGRAVCRQTLPSPTNLLLDILDLSDGHPERIYPSPDTLLQDLASAYRLTILHLYELGCRHVQLDDADCGHLSNPEFENRLVLGGIDLNTLHQQVINLINDTFADLPADLKRSIYVSAGSAIIPNWEIHSKSDNFMSKLLAGINVDRYYLPFRNDKPETLDILRYIPKGKEVVLGLMDAHSPIPDDAKAIANTVRAAEKYIEPANLLISPRTGFKLSEFAIRGLTYEDQWIKLQRLAEIAGSL